MRQAFVRELFSGNPELGPTGSYPSLGHGRIQQLEPLLQRLRHLERPDSAIDCLMDLDVLVRPASWPTLALVRVVQQLGGVDLALALSLTAQLALGLRLVKRFASEAQYRDVIRPRPPVFAFALTEASPGSDVSQIQTYAAPEPGGYRLSGVKSWVTNAAFATHFLVFARTVPPYAGNKPRLTAFLVPAGPGVSVRPVVSEVLPGSGVGEVHFDNVFLGDDTVVGTPGKGFRVVMAGLSEARLFLAAAATGASVRAFNETVGRLNERRAFGRAVGNFPSVQDRVAGMLADILALESLVGAVAGSQEEGSRVDPVEPAVVRLAASRSAGRVVDASRELFGAAAFVGNATAARRWTDMRALTLLDGSDSALESYIFLEGTREVRHRLGATHDGRDALVRLDAIGSHALSQMRARMRRVFSPDVPGVAPAAHAAFVHELGDRLQEELRSHGAEIVERQHVHRRLAAIVAELASWEALAARVASEVGRHGPIGARRMIEAAEIWSSSASVRIRSQFDLLAQNDDVLRDGVANRVYTDGAYPFDFV